MTERTNACDYTNPVTFHASLGILLLVALDADDFLVTRYETLVSNRLQANLAAETLLVPLLALVLVLLHACTMMTSIAVAQQSKYQSEQNSLALYDTRCGTVFRLLCTLAVCH